MHATMKTRETSDKMKHTTTNMQGTMKNKRVCLECHLPAARSPQPPPKQPAAGVADGVSVCFWSGVIALSFHVPQ